MKRKNPNKDNSEKDKLKKIILIIKQLEKDNSEKETNKNTNLKRENTEKGQI